MRKRTRRRRLTQDDEDLERDSVPRQRAAPAAVEPGSEVISDLDLPSRLGNRRFSRQVTGSAGPVVVSAQPSTEIDLGRWTELMESVALASAARRPQRQEDYEEIIASTARALLETGPGKRLKDQATQLLLNNGGRPLTLNLAAGTAAALLFAEARLPTIPVTLSENVTLTIDASRPLGRGDARLMLTLKKL